MGYKIKEMREKRKMTQERLAELSGVSRTTIWALESGNAKTTTTKTLLQIATALDTTVDQLFCADSV